MSIDRGMDKEDVVHVYSMYMYVHVHEYDSVKKRMY